MRRGRQLAAAQLGHGGAAARADDENLLLAPLARSVGHDGRREVVVVVASVVVVVVVPVCALAQALALAVAAAPAANRSLGKTSEQIEMITTAAMVAFLLTLAIKYGEWAVGGVAGGCKCVALLAPSRRRRVLPVFARAKPIPWRRALLRGGWGLGCG